MSVIETEKALQTQILELAKLRGWRTAHFGSTVKIVRRGDDYRTIPDKGAAGFPDLVLVRGPRLVFAELKGPKGKLSEDQQAWRDDLQQVAAHCSLHTPDERVQMFVWRPQDWDTIVEVLK